MGGDNTEGGIWKQASTILEKNATVLIRSYQDLSLCIQPIEIYAPT